MGLISVFLRSSTAYSEYLEKGRAGKLRLPRYEKNLSGEVIAYHGEVFCRMPNCEHRRIPLSPANDLRLHLSGHSGTLLAALPTGRLSQGTKDATIEWYEEVLRRSDEDEEEEAHCMGLIPVQRIQVDRDAVLQALSLTVDNLPCFPCSQVGNLEGCCTTASREYCQYLTRFDQTVFDFE